MATGEIKAQLRLWGGQKPNVRAPGQDTLDQRKIGGVVLNIEHGPRGFKRSYNGFRIHDLADGGYGQFDRKGAALPEGTRDRYRPAHQLDQAFGDRQADAGALHLGFLSSEPIERLEQSLQLVFGNAPARSR